MKGWQDIGSDMDWEDYGGLWARKSRDGAWFVVRFTNMFDACGEGDCRRDGVPQYLAEAYQVDLTDIGDRTLKGALGYIGHDTTDETSEQELVYACVAYGAYAPLESFSDRSYPLRARAKARRFCEALMRDADALEERLERPVNKIGTTAREYMQGDLNAALIRYQAGDGSPDKTKDLMLKLHGMPPREGSTT